MPYPSGTSQSDYRPTGRHTVKLGSNSYYFSYRGTAAFTFNPTDITVQNLSPDTWHSESTLLLGLDQETLTTDTRFASPKSVPRPVPQSGSQALTDEGGLQAYTQFDTGQRTRPKGAV